MFFKKKIAIIAVSVISAAAISASAFAADDEKAVVVGSQSLKPDEVVGILQHTAGGSAMIAGLMLSQSTLKERVEMVKQMADAVLMAEAAKLKGLEKRDDVALKLKWQHTQLLLQAYLDEISQGWDMSDKAMKKYYDEHKSEFVQAPAKHLRHILTSSEEEAKKALDELKGGKEFAKVAEKYSRDTASAPEGGDLGWVEKGTMPAELEEAVGINDAHAQEMTGPVKSATENANDAHAQEMTKPVKTEAGKKSAEKKTVGPVKSSLGWHILEVLESRPSKQLTFEEAKEKIASSLQMSYLEKELEGLRKNIKIEINEKALENLGGIPAPSPEKDDEAIKPEKSK
ncbi:MAG: peptidylprolyl isomerase [Synergistes sp.]|nr:peptidylprolyl isomerase [Synergistes sp.]